MQDGASSATQSKQRVPIRREALKDIGVDGQGMVHAPSAPGLGYPIDFELIERTKVAVLS